MPAARQRPKDSAETKKPRKTEVEAPQDVASADVLSRLDLLVNQLAGLREEMERIRVLLPTESSWRPSAPAEPEVAVPDAATLAAPTTVQTASSPEPEATSDVVDLAEIEGLLAAAESSAVPIEADTPSDDMAALEREAEQKMKDAGFPVFEPVPFDTDQFVQEFELAMANPVPIDWDEMLEDEGDVEPVIDPEEELRNQQALEELAAKHPDLMAQIEAFNAELGLTAFEPEIPEPQGQAEPEPVSEPQADTAAAPVPELELAEAAQPDLAAELQNLDIPAITDAPSDPVDLAPSEPTVEDLMSDYEPLTESTADSGEVVQLGFADYQGPKDVPSTDVADDANAPSPEALEAIAPEAAIAALALPWRISAGKLVCRVAEPFDEEAIAKLRSAVSLEIELVPTPIGDVVQALRATYSDGTPATKATAPGETPPTEEKAAKAGLLSKAKRLFKRAA